jgi:hypothetical protein
MLLNAFFPKTAKFSIFSGQRSHPGIGRHSNLDWLAMHKLEFLRVDGWDTI